MCVFGKKRGEEGLPGKECQILHVNPQIEIYQEPTSSSDLNSISPRYSFDSFSENFKERHSNSFLISITRIVVNEIDPLRKV